MILFRRLYFHPLNSAIYSNVYGLARTLFACSTLLTLLFNDSTILFAESVGLEPPSCQGLSKISIYCILHTDIELARWISVVILVFTAAGWRPCVTAIFHWWVVFSLNSSAIILDGGDQAACVLTLLLLPICLFDRRKWHWDEPLKVNNVTPFRDVSFFLGHSSLLMIRLQVAYIYFSASVEKFKVEEWTNGTALYYWFTDPYMGATQGLQYFLTPLITNVFFGPLLTWGVLIFELTLFLALVMEAKYRLRLLMWGILFHLAIAFIHGLFPFFFSMSAALILYLRPFNHEFKFSFYSLLPLRNNRIDSITRDELKSSGFKV